MTRLGFVHIGGFEFAVYVSDAPTSPRVPSPPLVERAETPGEEP